ncbi:MAG: hypothetical protein ACRC8S_03775 [Fimbriiglobus sp.]
MNEGLPPTRTLFGVLLVPVLALFGWQLYQLRAEGFFHGKILMAAIMMIPICLAGLINPKLANPWHSIFADEPNIHIYKIASGVGGGFIVVSALYVVIALSEGWWLPEFVSKALGQG